MTSPSNATQAPKPESGIVLSLLLAVLALSLFLQDQFNLKQSLLFLIGIALGVTLLHAAYGFSSAWRNFIRGQRSRGFRSHLLLIALTSLLMFPVVSGQLLDIKTSAALAPVGLSVAIGAFLFGIGMQLGSGCGSGTLYTVGGGHINMLITLTFFIIGATFGSLHLPWWLGLPSIGKVSIIDSVGWLPALLGQLALLALLYWFLLARERRTHKSVEPLIKPRSSGSLLNQLIFGPWPLHWAIISLALLNLSVLVLAGHAWSITFAFGLWGAKIASAIGFDVSSWAYWSAGYPAKALNSSVLADTTSLMDIGIVLGAILAAALAGSFAPEKKVDTKLIMASVIGGLLLGYGARLAFGCNIGGLLAGMATGSLHGWLWLVTGFAGAVAGVYIRIWIKLDKPMKTHH